MNDSRRLVIGVIGGNQQVGSPTAIIQAVKIAPAIGEAVVRAGCILLTGGKICMSPTVKDAAISGAANSSTKPARLIGILPFGNNTTTLWNFKHPDHLFLETMLTSEGRDPINGVTPDALICLAGGSGTLCELAFAYQAGRPVFFLDSSAALRTELASSQTLGTKLTKALIACESSLASVANITSSTKPDTLLQLMASELSVGTDFQGSVDGLVQAAISRAGTVKPETGFPGFKNDPHSKQLFEQIVRTISA